jgi:hypothetical protein
VPSVLSHAVRASIIAAALALAGCASHSERLEGVRSALDARSPREALKRLNEELEVDSEKQLPKDLGAGDASLLVLDRAMLLQQLDQYALSSRDLEACDKQIELLDFSRSALDDVGKYLFSDDTGPYKAPAYEKLFINTMNMVNYLARSDLNGARIEARRLSVMQEFIKRSEDPARAMLGPASYLAGFTFEKSGRPQEAMLYYDEALAYGDYGSLAEPIRRLASKTSYRSPRIRRILGEAEPATSPAPSTPPPATPEPATPAPESAAAAPEAAPPADDSAEILVIVSFGRVPIKIAKRVPIGLALTYASGFLSPHDVDQANRLAAQGLVTWVNYPELGKPRGTWDVPGFALDGKWMPIEGAVAIDLEAVRAWDDVRGAVVASAITRMISRIVAGEAVRQASGDDLVGTLLSLGTQATLTALDTPDTRSWEMLPARMAFSRVRVAPGKHWVDLEARGTRRRVEVNLKPGGFRVVNLTTLY